MKRVLAFAVLLLGAAGLAQVSGSFSGKLDLLPSSVALEEAVLSLGYTVAGFDITGEAKFTPTFTSMKFTVEGALGPADISAVMGFDPTVPAYAYTDLTATLSFASVDITTKVFHGVYDYGVGYFEKVYDPLKWATLCPGQTISDTLMLYTFEASVEPITITTRFLDCCEGILFYDFTLELEDLSFCCGITYDASLYFTKDGFQYVKFSADLFEICCGISFGMDLEFGADYKKVAPKFSWAGITNCITVWGDVVQTDKNTITGWELYGFKVYCELAECTYIEFVEAFDVDAVEKIIGNVFEDEKAENEYLKFGFCGPSCCGGTWTVEATIFFSAEIDPTLFGITRFLVETEVPVMDALSLSLDFGYNVPDAKTTLALGWTFTF
ncbi:hypothetical protein DRJ58_05775 [Candidatus Acetothermia bacterium]|nr:MAG: hypothetical protein DRJ58_05775 [Candidatus Acetothermia bacterium]